MSIGMLGKANLSESSPTVVYSCPASSYAVLTVNICNRTLSDVSVSLAVVDTLIEGTPTINDEDYIEYNTKLPPNGVLERGNIAISQNSHIVTISNSANISVQVYGMEDTYE